MLAGIEDISIFEKTLDGNAYGSTYTAIQSRRCVLLPKLIVVIGKAEALKTEEGAITIE